MKCGRLGTENVKLPAEGAENTDAIAVDTSSSAAANHAVVGAVAAA